MALDVGHQLAYVRSMDPKLAELLQQIVTAVNQTAINTATDPTVTLPPPSKIADFQVTAANGYAHVGITDHAPLQKGVQYFVEYGKDPSFQGAYTEHLGPSRNKILAVGDGQFYYRAFHQYTGSERSEPVAFGGNTPTLVAGGGPALPTLLPSSGSGTGTSNGQQPGSGIGPVLFRPATGPKRPALR